MVFPHPFSDFYRHYFGTRTSEFSRAATSRCPLLVQRSLWDILVRERCSTSPGFQPVPPRVWVQRFSRTLGSSLIGGAVCSRHNHDGGFVSSNQTVVDCPYRSTGSRPTASDTGNPGVVDGRRPGLLSTAPIAVRVLGLLLPTPVTLVSLMVGGRVCCRLPLSQYGF